MRAITRIVVCYSLSLAVVPISGLAHHSVTAHFDSSEVIEVGGILEQMFWRNPHVLFRLTTEDGSIWEVESGTPNTLERAGITADLFPVGEFFTVAGFPARREAGSVYATNVLLPDGREAFMDFSGDVGPRFSGQSDPVLDSAVRQPIDDALVAEATRRADGIFRVWTGVLGSYEWTASRTPVAEAAVAEWVPSRDDTRLQCVAPGMPDAMISPDPFEVIRDGEDIVIRIEEWDARRVIHMGATPDEPPEPTPMGFSVGSWEGSTLVVRTNRISWPHMDNEGTPQSEAVEIVERFILSDDERGLRWEATITDPINLTEPAVVRTAYEWIPGEAIQRFDCAVAGESQRAE